MPLVALAVLAPAPAAFAGPGDVVRDCAEDGSLDGSYSDGDKRAALGQIPADVDEYSDCRAVISGSIGVGGSVKAGIASAGTPGSDAADVDSATPRERKAAARKKARKAREARRERARKVIEKKLGARAVDPRDPGVFRAANTANGIPLPFTLAVIGLALITLAAGLLTLWRRNPALAGALRRVALPRFRR